MSRKQRGRVPEKGVEPSRPCGQRILSPPRVPYRASAASFKNSMNARVSSTAAAWRRACGAAEIVTGVGGGRLDAVGTERYPIGPVAQGPDAFRLERQSNMAFAVSIPSRALSEHRDLAFWMKRALQELAGLRGDASPDAVHDLRVALRRCRSVAAALKEIDPHPD